MKRLFYIYGVCIKTALAKVGAYRLNFALSFFITLFSNILFLLVTILIYNSGQSFPGWSFYEVLLIQSIFLISQGLSSIMFNEVLWSTMQRVREGSFEIVLLKPLNPLFFLISTSFEPEFAGMAIGGGVLFGVAVSRVGVSSVINLLQFLLLFAAGFAVMAGLNMIMAATAFKWVGNSRLHEIFDSAKMFGRYPGTIFPQTVRALTAFVIPVSMVGFFPAKALIGRTDAAMFIAVIPCTLFLVFGIWLYHHMVKLYESTGS